MVSQPTVSPFGNLAGTTAAPAPPDAIFAEFYSHVADRHQFVKTVCTDRWKLSFFLRDDFELSDLHADPDELISLIDNPAHAATRAALTLRIVDWICETADCVAPIVKRAGQGLAT